MNRNTTPNARAAQALANKRAHDNIDDKLERCERCGEALKNIVWLELSNTDGKYYSEIPAGHVSQGCFAFGTTCAKSQLAGR